MTVRWTTGFLDFPAATFEQGCSFWQDVTGYSLSPPRGESADWGAQAVVILESRQSGGGKGDDGPARWRDR